MIHMLDRRIHNVIIQITQVWTFGTFWSLFDMTIFFLCHTCTTHAADTDKFIPTQEGSAFDVARSTSHVIRGKVRGVSMCVRECMCLCVVYVCVEPTKICSHTRDQVCSRIHAYIYTHIHTCRRAGSPKDNPREYRDRIIPGEGRLSVYDRDCPCVCTPVHVTLTHTPSADDGSVQKGEGRERWEGMRAGRTMAEHTRFRG